MKFSKLETIVVLFLVAMLVIAIIFTPKISYVKNTDTVTEEMTQPEEITEPGLECPNEEVGGNQPKEAPMTEPPFVFEKQSFVATVVEETTKYMIVEPAENEEEYKISERINIVYPADHIDYLYGVGRRVIVQYTSPMVKQAPYFEITTDDILTDGYEDFEITVENSEDKKKLIMYTAESMDALDSFPGENKADLYYYGVTQVYVTVNGETMRLTDAIAKGYITLNGILKKCNAGVSNGIYTETRYDDGGSVVFNCGDYSVVKYHTIGEPGNRDVYIGSTDMDINVCNLQTDKTEVQEIHYPPYSDEWGLTLNIEDALNGVIYYFTQNGGDPSGELMYGSDYIVEKLVDGKWVPVDYILEGDVAWTAEAYYIPMNSSTEKKEISFDFLYGELTNGVYRFGKSVMDFRKTADFDKRMYYAEFTIE